MFENVVDDILNAPVSTLTCKAIGVLETSDQQFFNFGFNHVKNYALLLWFWWDSNLRNGSWMCLKAIGYSIILHGVKSDFLLYSGYNWYFVAQNTVNVEGFVEATLPPLLELAFSSNTVVCVRYPVYIMVCSQYCTLNSPSLYWGAWWLLSMLMYTTWDLWTTHRHHPPQSLARDVIGTVCFN